MKSDKELYQAACQAAELLKLYNQSIRSLNTAPFGDAIAEQKLAAEAVAASAAYQEARLKLFAFYPGGSFGSAYHWTNEQILNRVYPDKEEEND